MATISKQHLMEQLDEQLKFIEDSIGHYENNEKEAKRVATNIRILVHDTKKSTSLLHHLNAKNINFIDTNADKGGFANWSLSSVNMEGQYFADNLPYIGIVAKDIVGSKESVQLRYYPIYEHHKKFEKVQYPNTDFDTWWNAEIYDNKQGFTLTRQQLVLNMANKDGGAHVDELDPHYDSFKNSDILKFNVNENLQGLDNIPAYPAVMQIAWELLHSIKENYDTIKS